jgi:transposase-like protein
MTEPKKTRRKFTATYKAQVLDEAAAEGAVAAHVARAHGINEAQLYNWRVLEKDIRKAAKKEPAAPNGASNGASNGGSALTQLLAEHVATPVVAATKAETKSELRIIGLTPLIRELVIAELAKELPALVNAAVAGELKKAFLR